ncbi:MaoC family dehydratase N-terminal domain-containing protein [Kribbella solani]|uniref:MaoC family dehydratase n=1 Tax=Kribbella solani TaxID=236067 RepID=UPI0029BF4B68|nr:MaoC family dehydratase N-terminal domain-containing protein [Kribbella solani]MDX2968138.1 MaoC family dehydratase N-terminal domain-containing protein [Kribbella solani]MDX3004849.1 MaoC family dehydratase N-terminal domain-containing protein [Kribbella solani]
MAVDDTVLEAVRTRIGTESTHELGTITALMIRRYARAIGESNPLYYDTEFARGCGHPDIIAPPNLVTAVSAWDEGPAEDGLRSDGVPTAALQDLPTEGVRVMGGGEDIEFHAPIPAGTTLTERSAMIGAELTHGSKGPVIVVRYRHEFVAADGRVLLTSTRKVLLR